MEELLFKCSNDCPNDLVSFFYLFNSISFGFCTLCTFIGGFPFSITFHSYFFFLVNFKSLNNVWLSVQTVHLRIQCNFYIYVYDSLFLVILHHCMLSTYSLHKHTVSNCKFSLKYHYYFPFSEFNDFPGGEKLKSIQLYTKCEKMSKFSIYDDTKTL